MQEKGQIRSAEKSFCDVGTQCMPPCREFDLQLPELPSFDSLSTAESFTDGQGVTEGGEISGVGATITNTIEDAVSHPVTLGNETIVDSDCCSISTTIGLIACILVVILVLIFLIAWRFRRKGSSKLRDKYYPGSSNVPDVPDKQNAEAANGGGKSQLPSEQVPLNSWVRTPTLGPKAQSVEPVGESPSQVDVAEVSRIIDSETSLSQSISDDLLGQPEVRETQRPTTGLAADETQVPLNSGAHTSNLGSNAERPKPVGENAPQVGVSKGPKLVCVRSRTLPQVSSVNPLLVVQPDVPKILHSETFPQDKTDGPLGQPEISETQILPAESMVDEERTVIDLQTKTSQPELVNS